jgi:hypothetical protein
MGALANDYAPAQHLFTGIMGRRHCFIVEKPQQMLSNRQVVFEPSWGRFSDLTISGNRAEVEWGKLLLKVRFGLSLEPIFRFREQKQKITIHDMQKDYFLAIRVLPTSRRVSL